MNRDPLIEQLDRIDDLRWWGSVCCGAGAISAAAVAIAFGLDLYLRV